MNIKIFYSLTIIVVLLFFGATSIPAFERFDEEPHGMVGLGLGYAHHYGRTYEVDTVSGATETASEVSFADPGFSANLFGDFGLLELGPGTLGIRGSVDLSVPGPYFSLELLPRYRLEINTTGDQVTSLAPWLGLGLTMVFKEELDDNFFLELTSALGLDLKLGGSWYLGAQIDVSMVSFREVRSPIVLNGEAKEFESRLDNVALRISLSYLFY